MSVILEGDREEGEIVDDEFEEISDNSMILSFNDTGKSLYYKENLPVISLSSVSEDEDERRNTGILKKFHEKFRHHRHHHPKWKKKMKSKTFRKCHKTNKWKRLLAHSSSSNFNSDEYVDVESDRELQNQLKAAVKLDKTDSNRNSLRTRLKAMVKTNIAETEKNSVITTAATDNKINEQNGQLTEPIEENDKELMQLRVDALRSALLNKFGHKKRRIKDDNEVNNDLGFETNKENNIYESTGTKKTCLDVNFDKNSTPPDEDEDVLRALLLASISKKMSKEEIQKLPIIDQKPNGPNVDTVKPVLPLRQQITQKIKPIIINVSSDSDSVDEVNETNGKEKNINAIESSVDIFLREQRAKVEAQLKQNQKPSQKPIAKSNIPKQIQRQTSDDSIVLEKSSVKLLPKIKQIEYQRLLQKLKNAQKKSRIRKPSIKGSEGSSFSRRSSNQKISGPQTNIGLDIKHDAKALHATLNEMQKLQNGRLQMEEKYVVLTPIIRKINETTIERKKYDQEVKRLMGELAETKRKLQETHKIFSEYVKELMTKKDEIDRSPPLSNKNGESKIRFTSTPNKPKLLSDSLEISTVDCTPNDSKITHLKPSSNETISNSLEVNTLKTLEKVRDTIDDFKLTIQATKEKDIVFKMDGIEIINDVDVKTKEMDNVKNEVNLKDSDSHSIFENSEILPNYISPLDNVNRKKDYDPFVIMCPYDVYGNCRDPGCTYNHYSR